ncbi:hypothetical protein ACTVZO_39295 [Streptomyces sp. IBSNAI002]|uniref:hypothetical protein n=1 Tax=Streptomyces sp. IBSNAI002 TaxID=3457500 RepID=UPI003FD512C9
MVSTKRRSRVMALRADQWAMRKAAAQAALAVAAWDYPLLDEHDLLKTVHGLVHAAVAAGGKRVSIHLADQDAEILVMVLNHQTDGQDDAGQVPAEVAVLRTVDACGAHTDHDGHAWWALLDAQPRRGSQGSQVREQRGLSWTPAPLGPVVNTVPHRSTGRSPSPTGTDRSGWGRGRPRLIFRVAIAGPRRTETTRCPPAPSKGRSAAVGTSTASHNPSPK